MSFKKSRGLVQFTHTLIGFITLSPLHLYLVCGERSGTIWLPSHHSGGCCTLVVDEETPPPYYVKHFECPEKRYINVTHVYYNLDNHKLLISVLYCFLFKCHI